MGGDGLNAFPKHLPRLVGESKVKETFAVQSRVSPDNLYANCTKKFAIGSFSDLKFNQMFFQLLGG